MGFWQRLFTREDRQPAPTKKADSKQQTMRDGPKFDGREEETKAQKNADKSVREVIQEGEEYPDGTQANQGVDAGKVEGTTVPAKTKEEQRRTQPKPASKQRKTPREAKPGTGKPKAGQHKRKD